VISRDYIYDALDDTARFVQHFKNRASVVGFYPVGQVACVCSRRLGMMLSWPKWSAKNYLNALGLLAFPPDMHALATQVISFCLPGISNSPDEVRPWTVRFVSSRARFHFPELIGLVGILSANLVKKLSFCKWNIPGKTKQQILELRPATSLPLLD
jgi:hypothetical protein